MFESLAAYLVENAHLNAGEIELVRSVTIGKKLRKRQYLLQEGDVSKYDCFIVKGLLRMYLLSENGGEHIVRFATENWWISDQGSYNSGQPSKYNIDALEDSEILLIEKQDFKMLTENIPNFSEWKDRLKAKSYEVNQNRILSSITDIAEVRYRNFITAYPEIYKRVPLQMIASFLGVSRETLSRVRNQYIRSSI